MTAMTMAFLGFFACGGAVGSSGVALVVALCRIASRRGPRVMLVPGARYRLHDGTDVRLHRAEDWRGNVGYHADKVGNFEAPAWAFAESVAARWAGEADEQRRQPEAGALALARDSDGPVEHRSDFALAVAASRQAEAHLGRVVGGR